MKTNLHLSFNGQCQEAFEFYKEKLGGSISLMLSYGNTPMSNDVSDSWKEKISHATLHMNNIELSGTDLQASQYKAPQGFSILLEIETQLEAKRIFKALAEGGIIKFPLQKTFWSSSYGLLVDQFGIPWEINGPEA